MSDQTLDLRRSLQIARRHKIVIGIFTAVGLLAGAGYAVHHPPMVTSKALVVLPTTNSRTIATQAVIASSEPVLLGASRRISPPMPLQALSNYVQAKSLTPNILSISGQGKTAAQAEGIANAVAHSYIVYIRSAKDAGEAVQARLLESATSTAGTSLPIHLLVPGALGAVLGFLIGAIVALAISRNDRRLRERDEIANAVGVPVLASIPVSRPTDAGRWTKLLEDYDPGIVHGWQLRTALSYLGQSEAVSGSNGNGNGLSIAVVTLANDRTALALGPQLAVFAASLGIPTALVIGPQQDPNVTAALRAACAEPPPSSRQSRMLRLSVTDHDRLAKEPDARLTVIVSVVDSQAPKLAGTPRTSATVLGVTAGAASAAQLVGVAVNAVTDGRQVEGILVANPDPADHTTGRVPRLARPANRRMPRRAPDIPAETRR